MSYEGFCLVDEAMTVVHCYKWEKGSTEVLVDGEAMGVVDAVEHIKRIAEGRPTLRLCPLDYASYSPNAVYDNA